MAMQILAQRQALATKFGTDAPYGLLFTAAPPTTGAATNEVTGGTYARKALSWGAPDSSAKITGTATFDVPAGVTVTHFGMCASATAGVADVKDFTAITSQTFSTAGTLQVTATFTQS